VTDSATMRVLFVSDTHLGFDLPARPRVDRRRRGLDFFACFERALEPALRGEADVVVHGGDLLYRSRVPATLVHRALQPLLRVADTGVSVLLVPGNHERSVIPFPLLAAHPNLHVFLAPSTVVIERNGLRVAFAGFPYARGVRRAFPALLATTGYSQVEADARVLCIHQCVEGATCGPAPRFTFRDGDDVVRACDLPDDVAVVLCGHVHRRQVLRVDLQGRPLPAPVVYAGSVERTSFAERDEVKGFVLATVAAGGPGGRLVTGAFRPLPARPMRVHEVAATSAGPALDREIEAAVAAAAPDVVLQLRVPAALCGADALRAARLRALSPPGANVTVSARGPGGPGKRSARHRGWYPPAIEMPEVARNTTRFPSGVHATGNALSVPGCDRVLAESSARSHRR
jgi:UDP-2,3-diacylglucosamine pyrophosphatase LpxH